MIVFNFTVSCVKIKLKRKKRGRRCFRSAVKVRWLNEKRVFATQRKKEEEEKRMNVKVVIKYYLSVLRKSAIY